MELLLQEAFTVHPLAVSFCQQAGELGIVVGTLSSDLVFIRIQDGVKRHVSTGFKAIRSVELSPSGIRLALGSSDGFALFNLDEDTMEYSLEADDGTSDPMGMSFFGSQDDLIIGGSNELLWLFHREEQVLEEIGFVGSYAGTHISFLPGEDEFLCGTSYDTCAVVTFYKVTGGIRVSGLFEIEDSILADACFSPDGELLALALDHIWMLDSRTLDHLYAITKDGVFLEVDNDAEYSQSALWTNLIFADGGKHLIFGTPSGKIVRVDLVRRSLVEIVQAHEKLWRSLAISPDSKYLASVGEDWVVKVWRL